MPVISWWLSDKRYTRTEINWGQSNAIVAKAYKKHHLEEYGVPVSVVGSMTAKLLNGQINMYPITLVFFGVHDIIDAIGVYLHLDTDACLTWE